MVLNETAHNVNHETLAWLDYALRWSRSGDKTKLTGLLECVRSEVVFEMEHAAEDERPGLRQTG